MKKFLLLFCLFVAGIGMSAQKRYVAAISWGNYITLSGDVPSDMEMFYSYTDFDQKYQPAAAWVGDLLNMLSDRGFVVEQMNTVYNGEQVAYNYLLSKDGSAPDPASAVQRVQADDKGEAREVARYNLQGLPVKKDEKGIQIIVFSNYTTKTVIVE